MLSAYGIFSLKTAILNHHILGITDNGISLHLIISTNSISVNIMKNTFAATQFTAGTNHHPIFKYAFYCTN